MSNAPLLDHHCKVEHANGCENLQLHAATPSTRRITCSYDGIQRLTGAVESPGTSFGYTYDLAGNRTGGTVNGAPTTSYAFDALGRLTGTSATSQTRSYGYNGGDTLTSATVNGTSASYARDQAGGISKVPAA
jgi:YD repeat-containing protein